jgi:hypothetical protein
MDNESYDQMNVETPKLGSTVTTSRKATPPSCHVQRRRRERRAPAAVELTVSQTEPGVQGDRGRARKPATLETGLVVQVPLFVEPGEKIRSTPAPGIPGAPDAMAVTEAAAKLGSGPRPLLRAGCASSASTR